MEKGPIRKICDSHYIMGVALLAMLFCGSCAYYHTRLFDLDEGRVKGQRILEGPYGQKCGAFQIHPVIFAMGYTTGFHEGIEDPDCNAPHLASVF